MFNKFFKLKIRQNNMGKRGQVTIFIIIAIVIVVAALLLFLFWPKIQPSFFSSNDPRTFVSDCISNDLTLNVKTIESQGGMLNPDNYYSFQGNKIEYLCYNENNYLPCVMQQPLLKQHIEKEIVKEIESEAKECFKILKENYEKYKSYGLSAGIFSASLGKKDWDQKAI